MQAKEFLDKFGGEVQRIGIRGESLVINEGDPEEGGFTEQEIRDALSNVRVCIDPDVDPYQCDDGITCHFPDGSVIGIYWNGLCEAGGERAACSYEELLHMIQEELEP